MSSAPPTAACGVTDVTTDRTVIALNSVASPSKPTMSSSRGPRASHTGQTMGCRRARNRGRRRNEVRILGAERPAPVPCRRRTDDMVDEKTSPSFAPRYEGRALQNRGATTTRPLERRRAIRWSGTRRGRRDPPRHELARVLMASPAPRERETRPRSRRGDRGQSPEPTRGPGGPCWMAQCPSCPRASRLRTSAGNLTTGFSRSGTSLTMT